MNQTERIDKPFQSLVEFIEETDRVLYLTIYAVQHLRGSGRLAHVLYKNDPDKQDTIETSRRAEELAMAEVKNGFPLTFCHAAVSLWAALEATVPDYVAECIQASPKLLQSETFKKVKVPVAMIGVGQDDLARWIVQEVQSGFDPEAKMGIGRFQALLATVDVDASVDANIRRDLFELSQVRHLVVHRFGLVDQQFRDKCPFRNDEIGKRVRVTKEDYRRFQRAVREFAATIVERGHAKFGANEQ
jgi:hypothetical protein